ncbi:MAG: glycosyltransferase family 4 protein [Candidatus Chisholmbacteria bacterium]|nr:glycosyltransferase family 4 protein [Candidatus Chisholmbacteria bacterium]
MHIVLDDSRLSPLNQTRGIGVYTRKLFQALEKIDSQNDYQLVTNRHYLDKADLIHFPHFELFFFNLPWRKTATWVVTIHDVIPLVFPDNFPPGIRGRIKFLIQRYHLSQADAIITDSQNSKKDIQHYLGIPQSKTHVVYLGVAKAFRPLNITRKPWLLYVGDVNYNKNLPTLLEAFASLKSSHLNLVLVSHAWQRPIPEVIKLRQLITSLGLDDQVRTISKLTPTELVRLYNRVILYIQPSLYEGFGLPVLEAMACGTPVVCTHVASLPEIASSAAIMVPPTATALASGINRVLNFTSNERRQYVKAGIAQAKKFTWEKTAQDTLTVYNQVLNRQ